MRRLIEMRKAHRAFGRGTLGFLRPGNRKILAYVREYQDETILCVANLSRAPQAVELDLSSFKGRVPVELMGRSLFPPIGALPYLLTLSGHGFYVFRLASDLEPPSWHEEPPAVPDLPVLVLAEEGWHAFGGPDEPAADVKLLMGRRARQRLERQVIPRFFRAQPWFLDRDAVVEKFRFADLRAWSVDSGSWLLATVDVLLAGGAAHRYIEPLALAWEGAGGGQPESAAPGDPRQGPAAGADGGRVRRLLGRRVSCAPCWPGSTGARPWPSAAAGWNSGRPGPTRAWPPRRARPRSTAPCRSMASCG